MADQRGGGISWTDQTWNPIRGCTRVSEGCRNCYAETIAARFSGPGQPYEGLAAMKGGDARWTGKVVLAEKHLTDPLRWRRPRRIFVNSMSDLFHESVPDAWIHEIFAVMAAAPQHNFQVLTKRPARMREVVTDLYSRNLGQWLETLVLHPAGPRELGDLLARTVFGPPLPNIWLGVSAEDQDAADTRLPDLLATPAAVRFVSCEPLLGPIDLYNGDPDPRLGGHEATQTFIGDWWEPGDPPKGPARHGLDWVIVGGESGPGARPMHPDWARSLRDQCIVAEVPFHFKQHGEFQEFDTGSPEVVEVDNQSDTADSMLAAARKPSWVTADGRHIISRDDLPADTPCRLIERVGKHRAGRLLDGVLHDAMPQVLP